MIATMAILSLRLFVQKLGDGLQFKLGGAILGGVKKKKKIINSIVYQVLNALMIIITNVLWRKVARILTDWGMSMKKIFNLKKNLRKPSN